MEWTVIHMSVSIRQTLLGAQRSIEMEEEMDSSSTKREEDGERASLRKATAK